MGKYLGRTVKKFKGSKKVYSTGTATLSCLESKDGNLYVAHCLEFDLVAQGNTSEEAHNNLADLIKSHIEFAIEKDMEEKSIFHPAPQEYWDTFHHMKAKIAEDELIKQENLSAQSILDRMTCAHAY